MEEIYGLDSRYNLNFSDDKFILSSKENDKLKKSVGELIADYITSSTNNFDNEFPDQEYPGEFIFVFNDFSSSDSFLKAKNKINILVENRLDLDRLNFAIDFLKYIKHIENKLVLNMKVNAQGHFVSDYKYRGFYLEFKLYPDSWLKSFTLEYDSRELIKVSEYIEFGIKVIEHVYHNLSIFDTRMNGNEYSDAIEWLLEIENHFNRYPF